MKQYLLLAMAALAVLGLGYWLGCRSVTVTATETLRIDTVFYQKPQPIRVLPPVYATVRVPRVLFAPADTVTQTVAVAIDGDSVQMQVAVERKQYGDSTYRAQVSGPTIGGLHPTLDWIEVYNRTITQTQTIKHRSRFAVTAGIGAAYTPRGFQPYVGVGVGVILWQF